MVSEIHFKKHVFQQYDLGRMKSLGLFSRRTNKSYSFPIKLMTVRGTLHKARIEEEDELTT